MLQIHRNNLQHFCRTCLGQLQTDASNYHIGQTPNLTKLLVICTSLNINGDDAVYPQWLCEKCYDMLHNFRNFREMTTRSEEMLQTIVKESIDQNTNPATYTSDEYHLTNQDVKIEIGATHMLESYYRNEKDNFDDILDSDSTAQSTSTTTKKRKLHNESEYLDMAEICDDANRSTEQFCYDTTIATEIESPPGTSGLQSYNRSETYNLVEENNAILKEALKELKYLRQEQKTLCGEVQDLKSSQNFSTSLSVPKMLLNLPRPTAALFLELEEEVKKEENERALIKTFKNISDIALDKYVRSCLKTIVTDKVACGFSWFGHHENVPVHSFNLMNIIKECSNERFPNSKVGDVIYIIKKWFQYAKDRQRKKSKLPLNK